MSLNTLSGSAFRKIFEQANCAKANNIESLAEAVETVGLIRNAEEVRGLASATRDFASVTAFLDGEQLPTQPVLAFFADRLKVLLRDEGKRHDLVDAVFALGDDDLVRIVARVEALDAFLKSDDGASLLAGYKRASNILRIEEKKDGASYVGTPQTLPASAPQERTLMAALDAASPQIDAYIAQEDYTGAMIALSKLRRPLDDFFDTVFVNDPDFAVRRNRLLLLSQIRAAADRIADFSRIAG